MPKANSASKVKTKLSNKAKTPVKVQKTKQVASKTKARVAPKLVAKAKTVATVKKAEVKKPVAKAKAKAAVPAKKKSSAKSKAPLKVAMNTASFKKHQPTMPMKQAAKPVAVAEVAAKPAPAASPVKLVSATKVKSDYKVGSHVVYPTHGVGKIIAEESQKIGDVELRVFVIAFDKDKMILRVPVHRAAAAGLRHISNGDDMQKAFSTLKGRARASRGMWSRRAQEYEAKINSGNIVSIAEVVRDLHRNVDQSERSYSERMIYESAFSRLVGELAAAEALDAKAATDKLIKVLKTQVAA